jgi:hypothetical protein
MSWEAIGAIGEVVGAIAVVLTLVYLAVQVRENTKSSRIQERQNTTRQFADTMDILLLHPELADIHDKGRDNPEELSTKDLIRFRRLLLRFFWYLSAQHQQYVLGTIGDDEWAESIAIIRAYIARRGVQEWWNDGHGRSYFSPSFTSFLDEELAKIK